MEKQNKVTRSGKKKFKGFMIWLIIFSIVSIVIVGGLKHFVDSVLFGEITPAVAVEDETLKGATKARAEGKDITISMDEDQVLATMNKMTHQKIKASDKWGAVEMTKGNIKELRIIVKRSDFDSKLVMIDILDRWYEGDFDTIVEDHNTIWDMQGGSIGEATGEMSEKEEKEFIEDTFE